MNTNEITNRIETALAGIEKGFDTDQPPQVEASIANIKILRESQQFQFPDETTLDGFTANILFYHRLNSYFAGPYDPDAVAECLSIDAKMPSGGENPRPGPCSTCPLNEFGSAETGAGKACGNYLNLFLLREGDEIPYVLRCPPTSLGKRGSLLTFLTYAPSEAKKTTGTKAYQLIVTEFSLQRQTFASGISSVVVPHKVGVLDIEKDAARIKTLMLWYQRIHDEWEAGRVRGAEVRQEIEKANAELDAERSQTQDAMDGDTDSDDNVDESEVVGAAVPNPDYVGDDPAPVPEGDPIPF